VEIAENADRARALLLNGAWDVVVTDIVLPGLSGVELLKAIRAAAPDVQVIMMTASPPWKPRPKPFGPARCDYLSKPIIKNAILRSVATAVQMKQVADERRRYEEENRKYQESLEKLVEERTEELRQALDGTIHAMAAAVESRDPYTAGHQERVADLAAAWPRRWVCRKRECSGRTTPGSSTILARSACPRRSSVRRPGSPRRRWTSSASIRRRLLGS